MIVKYRVAKLFIKTLFCHTAVFTLVMIHRKITGVGVGTFLQEISCRKAALLLLTHY